MLASALAAGCDEGGGPAAVGTGDPADVGGDAGPRPDLGPGAADARATPDVGADASPLVKDDTVRLASAALAGERRDALDRLEAAGTLPADVVERLRG